MVALELSLHMCDVHDVDVQPVGALLHCSGAIGAQLGKVSREDGRCNDSFRRHYYAIWL